MSDKSIKQKNAKIKRCENTKRVTLRWQISKTVSSSEVKLNLTYRVSFWQLDEVRTCGLVYNLAMAHHCSLDREHFHISLGWPNYNSRKVRHYRFRKGPGRIFGRAPWRSCTWWRGSSWSREGSCRYPDYRPNFWSHRYLVPNAFRIFAPLDLCILLLDTLVGHLCTVDCTLASSWYHIAFCNLFGIAFLCTDCKSFGTYFDILACKKSTRNWILICSFELCLLRLNFVRFAWTLFASLEPCSLRLE